VTTRRLRSRWIISKRRSARRMIVELLSLSRSNGNTRLNHRVQGSPLPKEV
jgi:hypothetical protein